MTLADQFRNEGREEGIVQGLQKGIVQGREEGAAEKIRVIACNMLAENFPLETISKVTGISVEDLKKLSH